MGYTMIAVVRVVLAAIALAATYGACEAQLTHANPTPAIIVAVLALGVWVFVDDQERQRDWRLAGGREREWARRDREAGPR